MEYEVFKNLNHERNPETQVEFDALFCKLAEDTKPESFAKLEELVKEAFQGKYDNNFLEWGEKLKLDRKKLTKLFVR